jgi:large subunit ribosomal protein L24
MASSTRTANSSAKRLMKIHKGDQVQVMAGKDRGKRGSVLRVDLKHERVYVEGLNMRKRHIRPQQTPEAQRGQTLGGVIESEGPIHVSNVMLLDPKNGKPTRVGIERENGRPFRVARRSGVRID